MDDDVQQSFLQTFSDLTRREYDILVLLTQGLSDREISNHLFLSLNTVKWYNRQIFDKLGVKNRRQATERAFALNLIGSQKLSAATPHNLPAQITPFIGRAGELADLMRLLQEGPTRLITLLAPGGMGKTRLALAAAENCLSYFFEGIYLVPLASLVSSDQLIPAIADAMGLQLTADRRTPKQQVLSFLGNKRTLLVLDNFEHLLEGAPLLSDLLDTAPHLHLLVTSRERLNLSCETLYALWGMGYPESAHIENALDYSAVQLLFECGRRLTSETNLEDISSIVKICQLTQGMPLAIELAAAWLVALSPTEIVAEIARSIDFLQTNMRNIPERQRSIRAVFEASWQQLGKAEQNIFAKLSVFQGGFTREAIQAVTDASTNILIGLVNKALISRTSTSGQGRYQIHELLRQFAREKLARSGETEATLKRHALYFADFLSIRLPKLQTRIQQAALDEIEADFDNIREAVHYLLDSNEAVDFLPILECLRLFFEARVNLSSAVHHPGLPYTSLRLFFEARSHFSADATSFFSKAALTVRAPDAQVSIREGLGDTLQMLGIYDQAYQEYERALEILPANVVVPHARLLRKQARTLDAQSRFQDALLVLAEADIALNNTTDRDEFWWQAWIAVQIDMTSVNFFLGRLESILEGRDALEAVVERYGTPIQRFDFYVGGNAIELARTGHLAVGKAMEFAQRGLASAREAGGLLQIALAHIRVGLTYNVDALWSSAETEFLAGLAPSERVGNVLTQAICTTFLAYSWRMRQQVKETEYWAKRAYQVSSGAGIDMYLAFANANLAWVSWRTRDLPQATMLAQEAQRIWQQASPYYPLRYTGYWVTFALALNQNALENAIDCVRQMLTPPQLPPPAEITLSLKVAIQAWEGDSSAKCLALLAETAALAESYGFI